MNILILRTEGTVERSTLTNQVSGQYRELQRHVDGWIDRVGLPRLGVDIWVNDEGLLLNLPRNPAAEILTMLDRGHDQTDAVAAELIGQPLVLLTGDAVVTGPPDDVGDTTDLTEDQIAVIVSTLESWGVDVSASQE